jgi:hypothetical protein
MAISIPASVTTQFNTFKTACLPHLNGTATYAAAKLFPESNRIADFLEIFTNLIDATGLTVTGIHGATGVAHVTNPALYPCTDQGSADLLMAEFKTQYNLHIPNVAGSVHHAADVTNAITLGPTDGTEPTLQAMVNQAKAKFNAHAVRLTTGHRFADAAHVITTADGSDLATDIVLLNALTAAYNAHVIDIGCSTSQMADFTAFTTASSLQGAKITFTGNVTTALADETVYIGNNTTTLLTFSSVLAAAPQSGDTYAIAYTSIDDEIELMRGSKTLGQSASQPYSYGATAVNAIYKLIKLLGGTPSSVMTTTPFGLGSPHAGGSTGHGGTQHLMFAFQTAKDLVAAYTKPA